MVRRKNKANIQPSLPYKLGQYIVLSPSTERTGDSAQRKIWLILLFLGGSYIMILHVASFGDEIQVFSLMYIFSEFKPFNKASGFLKTRSTSWGEIRKVQFLALPM